MFLKIRDRGFTLVEMAFVVAIIMLLALIALVALFSVREKSNLGKDAQGLVNVLRLARNKTIASEGAARYGVHFISDDLFSPDKYILFKERWGTSDDIIFELSKQVEFQQILSSDDVIFSRITGQATPDGNIILGLISDPSQTVTIYIDASGKIDWMATPAASLPLKDSRHVHFNLNWSIQNATTLKFDFPAEPLAKEVNMANYFNADKTNFDWSGSFTVAGSEQKFRVHTHLLDPALPSTILSITRDRNNNKNNQEVYIYIVDGGIDKEIAHYSADTVTQGFYVQTMEIQ